MSAELRARVTVRRETFAVDVELSAAPGETVAVMGPSGAGKSTLLGALAGLVPLDAGEVVVDGRVLDRVGPRSSVDRERRGSLPEGDSLGASARARTENPRLRDAPGPERSLRVESRRRAWGSGRVHVAPMHRGVVLLGQDARLFPHLTARENVEFGPRSAGLPRAKARADAEEWLQRVGLAGAGSRRPGELSGGQQQRVAVARALAASPRVVLLDEPLVALDPATASEIRAMLREQLVGVTTIAVTHDAVDAVALADRLMVIEDGLLTQTGPVRDVIAAPATAFVAAIAGVTRLLGVSARGGWEGLGFRLEAAEPALEPDGAPLAAVFRPDAVRLSTVGGANSWTARVQALEPVPAGVRARTDRGDVDLGLFEAEELRPGDALRLAIDPAHIRFIPA